MGDVLKDSFVVVGEDMALARPLEILTGFVSGSNGVFRDGTRWQDVEAPLFALRAMGGLVSKDESKVRIEFFLGIIFFVIRYYL